MKTVIAALARGRCPHRGPWTSTQMPDVSAAVVLKDNSPNNAADVPLCRIIHLTVREEVCHAPRAVVGAGRRRAR